MLSSQTYKIQFKSPDYPQTLTKYLAGNAPKTITAIGNLEILQNKTLALFCSTKCPGNIILKTYDLMKRFRESGITVISGFHSPMERECLNILLKGKQLVIVCPARSIEGMRIKEEFRKPLDEGRLLVLSPFTEKVKRISSERALERNRFIAALADNIFSSPNSKTELFCRNLLMWNKPLYTLDSETNSTLITIGAKPITFTSLKTFV